MRVVCQLEEVGRHVDQDTIVVLSVDLGDDLQVFCAGCLKRESGGDVVTDAMRNCLVGARMSTALESTAAICDNIIVEMLGDATWANRLPQSAPGSCTMEG